jgi:DNA-binding transcriptional regulator YdaS (Cro superfamily)
VLAGKVGVSSVFLSQIAAMARPCPADRATAIERGSDLAVMRWDLRPNDWHLIWPELIGTEGAPAVPSEQQEVRDAA